MLSTDCHCLPDAEVQFAPLEANQQACSDHHGYYLVFSSSASCRKLVGNTGTGCQRIQFPFEVVPCTSKVSTNIQNHNHCERWSIHFTSLFNTTSLTMRSSPKRLTSIPLSSSAAKSMPLCFNSSIESRAYISSFKLNSLKLNCQMQNWPLTQGKLPFASVNVKPNWISFSMSTLQRSVW